MFPDNDMSSTKRRDPAGRVTRLHYETDSEACSCTGALPPWVETSSWPLSSPLAHPV